MLDQPAGGTEFKRSPGTLHRSRRSSQTGLFVAIRPKSGTSRSVRSADSGVPRVDSRCSSQDSPSWSHDDPPSRPRLPTHLDPLGHGDSVGCGSRGAQRAVASVHRPVQPAAATEDGALLHEGGREESGARMLPPRGRRRRGDRDGAARSAPRRPGGPRHELLRAGHARTRACASGDGCEAVDSRSRDGSPRTDGVCRRPRPPLGSSSALRSRPAEDRLAHGATRLHRAADLDAEA